MRLLLDTCTFLWLILDHPRLSATAREALSNPEHEVLLSAASAWEIAVKQALGKLALPEPAERYLPRKRTQHAIESLALDEESTLQARSLVQLHRDPFDRLLVCQAIIHGLVIATPDEAIRQYPVRTVW